MSKNNIEVEQDYKDWIQSAFFPTIRRLDERNKPKMIDSFTSYTVKAVINRQQQVDKAYIKIHHPLLSHIPFITQTYGPCLGLTLFKLGRYKLELWFAPADYEIKEHTHPNSDGIFFVVYGKGRDIWKIKALPPIKGYEHMYAQAQLESYNISGRKYFKTLKVRANEPHAFGKGKTQMIWLCLEKWKPEVKVTSVATDIKF